MPGGGGGGGGKHPRCKGLPLHAQWVPVNGSLDDIMVELDV